MGSPTIVSLFSGIGGLDIGVEAATGGRVVLNCEADAYCRSVLAKHWPEALQVDDVRAMYHRCATTVAPAIPLQGCNPDLVIGGFPCQDLSVAGKMKGLDGERSGLWFEMLRVIDATKPAGVFIENVVGIRKRGLSTVVRGLTELGYNVVWSPLAAAHVGAPHRRSRMWIYARHEEARGENMSLRGAAASIWERNSGDFEPWERGVPRVLPKGRYPGRVQRLKAIGNAVVPECARQAFLLLNEEMDDLEHAIPRGTLPRSQHERWPHYEGYDLLHTFPTKDGHPPLGGAVVEGHFVSITRIDRASRLKKLITYPTPAASQSGYNQGGAAGRVGPKRHSLNSMAASGHWPTPTPTNQPGLFTRVNNSAKQRMVERIWATPTVQDSANNGGPSQFRRNSLPLNAEVAGPLNPTWVELLMGFEPDHTEVIQ